MSSDGVEGLTVHVRDRRPLGVVVGVFAEGPRAGRLRASVISSSQFMRTAPGSVTVLDLARL